MSGKKHVFLNEAERRDLLEAIREGEKRTSAEVVVIVKPNSSAYPHAALFGSIVVSTVVSILVNIYTSFSMLWSSVPVEYLWIYPSVFAVCFIGFYYLINAVAPLKRVFIPGDVLKEEVFEAAVTSFHIHGLGHTTGRNGILFYISIFERQVYILTDSGINDVIDKKEWEMIVLDMVKRIKNGERKTALIEGVGKAVSLLEPCFPPNENDSNELPGLFIDDEKMG